MRWRKPDREVLDAVLSGGIQPGRVVLRGLALRPLPDGQAVSAVAAPVQLTPKAVREIGRRYEEFGLDRALQDKPRPGAQALRAESRRPRLIAMVCRDPPAGRARWTDRLITEEAVKCPLVPQVGRETIRLLLLDHDLQPWREKMGGVPEREQDYLHKREDVLATQEKPYHPAEPVLCLEEKPVTRHADGRPPSPPAPGREARDDNEQERRGTANVFCAIEPKAGQPFTFATPSRSGAEFAQVVCPWANHYPEATTLHLVLDNLNIQRRKSLTDFSGEEVGHGFWNRFTLHDTPRQGSWLHQAESESSLFSRPCLGKRRIPDLATLRRETRAWTRRIRRARTKIN